jgi:hypothetical protein
MSGRNFSHQPNSAPVPGKELFANPPAKSADVGQVSAVEIKR